LKTACCTVPSVPYVITRMRPAPPFSVFASFEKIGEQYCWRAPNHTGDSHCRQHDVPNKQPSHFRVTICIFPTAPLHHSHPLSPYNCVDGGWHRVVFFRHLCTKMNV